MKSFEEVLRAFTPRDPTEERLCPADSELRQKIATLLSPGGDDMTCSERVNAMRHLALCRFCSRVLDSLAGE